VKSMTVETNQEREPLQALEQKRASKAWTQVSEVPLSKGKEYHTSVRQAPAMIKTSGLGQTLAFLLAKEKKDARKVREESIDQLSADGLLYKHLEEWLIGDEGGTSSVSDERIRRLKAPIPWTKTDKTTIIERVLVEDSTIYRQATREALAYLGWLKRFAEARFGKKVSES
jgi:CRISPR-associated protein Cmr5